MKLILSLFLSIFCTLQCYPQNEPAKFGKITKDLLEMKVYDKDTSAAAVIICEYGHYLSNESKFIHFIRIKILKKEGYSWANKIFPTSSKADVRGITYNLENGEIVKEKLQNQNIYAEHIRDDFYNMRITMPNIKVGSVFDIEFVYNGFPRGWNFQEEIPVLWSELDIGYSSSFDFRKNFFGYEPLFINEEGRWVGKDMPAFKAEPFLNSSKNYMTRCEFDISRFTQSWDYISHLLLEYDYGGAIAWSYYLNDIANGILGKKLSAEDKIDAAFKAVKIIKWNGRQSCFVEHQDLSYPFNHQLGNSAEINLNLLMLLKKLDFDPLPLVLSTRKNGILSPATPSILKLNHVIVYLEAEGKKYWLDASEDYMPFNLLPEKCLNWQGVLLKDDKGSWIELPATKKDKELVIYNLVLNNDLNFTGKINHIRYDYAGYNFRKNYFSFNGKSEFIADYGKNKAGLKILDSHINNLDSLNIPIEDNYNVTITDQLLKIGDEYYLYPLLYEQIKDNPFKSEERNYPIDFAYKREKTITINIQIPPGFEIVEVPKSIKMKLTGDAGYFVYSTALLNNQLAINFKYSIDKEIILPDQYQEIKEFYNQIIIKHSQPILLKKKV